MEKAEQLSAFDQRFKPEFSSAEFRRPQGQYLIRNEETGHLLYTYIRKNACSSFKALMLDRAREKSGSEMARLAEFLCADPQEYASSSVFIYRDPVERLVSAFVNKFVQISGNKDVFNNFEERTGNKAETATFREVVDYVGGGFPGIDPHFWPQKSHLADIEYRHAIDIGMLSAFMEAEFPSISEYFKKPVNKSIVRHIGSEDLCDVPANQLQGFAKENARKLEPLVRDIYEQDYAMISTLSGWDSVQS